MRLPWSARSKGSIGHAHAFGGHTHDHGLAAAGQQPRKRRQRLRAADRLEGVVELALGGGHRARRAQRQRLLAPPGIEVDGDDRIGAREHEAEHDRLPDAAAADDHRALPRPHARGVQHRADARGHRAADQRRDLRRHGRIDRHHRGLRDHGRLGERPEPEEGMHARRRPKGARARACRVHSHARPDAHCTQRRQGANHDSTTLSPTATSRTSGPIASTTPGALVAEHERQRDRPVAVERVQVGVADAARGQPHPDLVADRVRRASRSARAQRADAFEDLRPHDDRHQLALADSPRPASRARRRASASGTSTSRRPRSGRRSRRCRRRRAASP